MTKFLNLARGLTFSGPSLDKICQLYMRRRQGKKVNQIKKTRVKEFLGLVHFDVGKLFLSTIY